MPPAIGVLPRPHTVCQQHLALQGHRLQETQRLAYAIGMHLARIDTLRRQMDKALGYGWLGAAKRLAQQFEQPLRELLQQPAVVEVEPQTLAPWARPNQCGERCPSDRRRLVNDQFEDCCVMTQESRWDAAQMPRQCWYCLIPRLL